MSNPLGEWAHRAALLPGALVEATPDAVRSGAEVFEDRLRAKLLVATGGDLALSRVRSGKGARITLETKVLGAGRSARGVVAPGGPIMLVDQPTKPHRQPFDYSGILGAGGRRRYATAGEQLAGGGVARRRRARRVGGVVVVPGYGPRARVRHPGTPGKRLVEKTFTEVGADAGRTGVEVFAAATRRHMGGRG